MEAVTLVAKNVFPFLRKEKSLTLYGPYILESVVHDGFAFSASCAFVSSAPAD